MLVMSMGAVPAIAANAEIFDETELGAKIDAPNLIKITKNNHIGIEVGLFDLTKDFKDGSFAFAKWTYTGCLLNCK